MQLVDFDKLPKAEDIQDVPLDDPMKIFKICQEMEQVCEREKGIGLSAVQVGIPLKLFIIKSDGSCPFIEKGKYGYFANTNYEVTGDDKIVSLEGCLSIRSQDGQLRFFQVERQNTVHINGHRLNVDNNFLKFDKIDLDINVAEEGIVFQHEIDHSFSVTIDQIGKEVMVW